MGETYDEGVMSIIITDMSFKYNDEEIISKLKRPNQHLLEHDIKVVKSYEYKKYNKIIYNAKIIINK